MASKAPESPELTVRPYQLRDFDKFDQLAVPEDEPSDGADPQWRQVRRWYGLVKSLSWFPNPFQHLFCTYVAEEGDRLRGMIQVSPINHTRSTWRIDRLLLRSLDATLPAPSFTSDVGSQLIRYCLQSIWEARTWLIEIDKDDSRLISLSRHNGFQPLGHRTYWAIAPDILEALAAEEPDLPNLLPVSNADAGLIHQLDTFSMPATVRQVFDRHIPDFKTGMMTSFTRGVRHWFDKVESVRGYVFEPQRKAAIGYFQLYLCRDGSQPHTAELTVHPEYTWLYPELICQMSRSAQAYPAQALRVTSTDYQPEREEYLQTLGAERMEHTVLLSRSVWHKVRESRALEALQLPVLQGLQPSRKAVPSRFSLLQSLRLMSGRLQDDSETSMPRPLPDGLRDDLQLPPHSQDPNASA